jgi:DNA mismatch endonuclease, patch repair protein
MDPLSPEQRSALMSRIRSKDTRPEMELRRALFRRGFRYRIHRKGLPGKPDIVFAKARLAVFCHGCFWHGHEGCYKAPATNAEFWKSKLDRNKARDENNKRDLESLGWRVLQVWECHIYNNIDAVVYNIASILHPSLSAALEKISPGGENVKDEIAGS